MHVLIIKEEQLFRGTMPVRGHSSTGLNKQPSQNIHAYPLPCALLQSYKEDNSDSSCPWLLLGFPPARSLTKKHQVSHTEHKRDFRVCWRPLSCTASVGPARGRTRWDLSVDAVPITLALTTCTSLANVDPWAVLVNFACSCRWVPTRANKVL